MISSRKLEDLRPRTRVKMLDFEARCALVGIDILWTSTYRDNESQDALYAQGRNKPGNIITKARGGESFHNYRVAADYVPLMNGKPDWENESLWHRSGAIAAECGLEWGGTWARFPDKPHLQDAMGFSIGQYKAGAPPA